MWARYDISFGSVSGKTVNKSESRLRIESGRSILVTVLLQCVSPVRGNGLFQFSMANTLTETAQNSNELENFDRARRRVTQMGHVGGGGIS